MRVDAIGQLDGTAIGQVGSRCGESSASRIPDDERTLTGLQEEERLRRRCVA